MFDCAKKGGECMSEYSIPRPSLSAQRFTGEKVPIRFKLIPTVRELDQGAGKEASKESFLGL